MAPDPIVDGLTIFHASQINLETNTHVTTLTLSIQAANTVSISGSTLYITTGESL